MSAHPPDRPPRPPARGAVGRALPPRAWLALLLAAGCGSEAPVQRPVAAGGGVLSGDLPGDRPPPPDPVYGWPELQAQVPTWSLTMAPADRDRLFAEPKNRELSVPGVFTAEGRDHPAEISLRGRSTRLVAKKSFKVELAPGQTYQGRRRFALLAQYRDGGILTEKLWYDLAAAAGLRVPRAQFVSLEINGAFYGVMTDLEIPDKRFLAAHGYDPDADIYRCGMWDCELRDGPPEPFQEPWDKKTNEDESHAPLADFLRRVNRTPPPDFAAMFDGTLDGRAYLTWLAVDAAIGNRSISDSRSYLVREKRSGRWTYVPWDLNNAVSTYDRDKGVEQEPRTDRAYFAYTVRDPYSYAQARSRGWPPAWSVLSTRAMEDDDLRARYAERLGWLLQEYFREDVVGPRVDAMQALLAPHLARDPFVDPAYPPRSAAFLRRWVEERREYLLSRLARIESPVPGDVVLESAGMDASERRVVSLRNRSTARVSLSGWGLSGWMRGGPAALPDVALAPGEVATLREGASDPARRLEALTDPAYPELGLYPPGAESPADTVHLPPLEAGRGWQRDGTGARAWRAVEMP